MQKKKKEKKKNELIYVTMGLDVFMIHVCTLIQELSFDFFKIVFTLLFTPLLVIYWVELFVSKCLI